jgi:hypothetical protein
MPYRTLLTVALVLAGCNSAEEPATTPTAAVAAGPALPVAQLERARNATARYHDVQQAIADGYVDINVVRPHMGRHFLKESLLDGTFDPEHPELLVYSPDANGKLQLVAVEYAVPLAVSATAPEGFQGSADSWVPDVQFPLWTLHAWVWSPNPDGIFSPMNSRVP